MKRLCLYLTYDKQNIVDRYIGYMLKELKMCVDSLSVICNEKKISKGQVLLDLYADQIFLRENIGLDAGGFKDALCNLIGWSRVLEYDELVLVNDSFFGPFCPMKNIFHKMDSKEVDFWGLMKHAEWISADKIYFPEHIQSFFLVIRKDMLHSEAFKQYWEEMSYYTSYDEVVIKHERVFTQFFSKLGYTYGCYADVEANNSNNKLNNFNQYFILAYEMIRKRNFPFFKKQQLACESMELYTQENQMLAIDYIDQKTNYDVDMIWENIIRTMDVTDLYLNLHLHFVLPDENNFGEKPRENICIVVYACYKRSAEYVQEYLYELREKYEIIVCSSDCVVLEQYRDYNNILLDETKGYKSLVDNLSDVKYVCVIHDTDLTGDMEPSYVGKSYFYSVWENLVKGDGHIQKVVELFEKQKWLGFLAPPMPYFNRYFSNVGAEWGNMYQAVSKQAEYLGIEDIIQDKKKNFAITNSFWIRGSILKKLSNYQSIDYKLLPYLWIYITQNAGYYSGIVESAGYAGMNIVNLQYSLNMIGDQVRRQYGDFGSLADLQKYLLQGALQNFSNKFNQLYIYGAGAMEKQYRSMLPEPEAYIVSDGQAKKSEINGKKVIYLSEVPQRGNIGIIVCLNKKNRQQAVSMLQEKGFINYICI